MIKKMFRKQDNEAALETQAGVLPNSADNHRFSGLVQAANAKWAELPSRDQLALIILTVFLVLVVGGYGGYAMNQAANEQKETYQTAVNDYFWLRAQSSNINPNQNSEQATPLDQSLTQLMAQMGATNPQVLVLGDAVQISFSHDNQIAASNVIGAMVNSGINVQQLAMQQNPDNQVMRVQATVSQ